MRLFRSRKLAVAIAWLMCAATGLSGQTGEQQQSGAKIEPRKDSHVIIISIDGLPPDHYTSPGMIGLQVPNLVKLKLGGAYAEGVEGVYPSVTYPAHTTIVTGVRPASHGIFNNRIFEPPTAPQTREWYWFSEAIKAETLWMIAKKAGLVTAAVGWPVTAGAQIDYNIPEILDPKEDPPTTKRAVQYSTPGLIAKAFGLATTPGTTTDSRRAAASEYIITTHKPNLMLIHLVELDTAQHQNGPRTPAAIETAEREDAYLGRIIESARKAGIFDQTTFFIVSDHGFASVEKKFEPNVILVKEKLITLDGSGKPVDWKAAAWPAGGACAIVLRDPADKQTAEKVAAVFGKIALRRSSPLNRVLNRNEIDRLGAIPGATLMLEAAPGYAFDELMTGPEIHDSKDYRGTHGQLPTRADMRSSLIIYGAGARVGAKVPLARMIDIAPSVAGLLGLSLSKTEGTAIKELLRPGLIAPDQAGGRAKNKK